MGKATFFQGQAEENDHIQLQKELILLKSHDLSNISLEFINNISLHEYLTHEDRMMASSYSDGVIDCSIGEFILFWKEIRNAIEHPQSIPAEILASIENRLPVEHETYQKDLSRGDGGACTIVTSITPLFLGLSINLIVSH